MATYISLSSGNWSSASTWLTAVSGVSPLSNAGQPPQSNGGDKIIIRGGHIVTYDTNGIFGDQTSTYSQGVPVLNSILANAIILSGGTLKASREIDTSLTARGTILIAPSGTLDWGTTIDPLTTNSTITLHYMSQLSALSASTASAGMYLYGASADDQLYYNNIWINGSPKTTNAKLALSANTGDSVLTLTEQITALKWKVGDKLVICTENISSFFSYTNIPNSLLSATFIQSFTGNQITISPELNNSRSVGTYIGNFTKNVKIKSFNPLYPSFGIYINTSNAFNVDINHTTLEFMGYGVTTTNFGPVGWTPYAVNGVRATGASSPTVLGALTINCPYTVTSSLAQKISIKGLVLDFAYPSNTTVAFGNMPPVVYGIYVNGKWSESIDFDDTAYCAIYNGTQFFINYNSVATGRITNTVCYRATNPIAYSSAFPNKLNFDNCFIDGINNVFSATFGLAGDVTNSTLRHYSGNNVALVRLDAIQNLNFKNCNFVYTVSTGAAFTPNINAIGTITMSNCNYYFNKTLSTSINKTISGALNRTAQSAQFNAYQVNNNPLDYRRFNYFHYSQTDLINRKNGITSYRIKPDVTNTEFYNYFTINGVAGVSQRIKGNIEFDSNYGTQYPPTISFVGAGVNVLCSFAATPDVWQPFDLTLNPTSTDDIIMTITARSSATTGYVWVDGIPINPFIQDVRHYGFVFDKTIDRTVNNLNTLTENQISALSTVSNLDYLYDEATYWSVLNPSISSYIDLVTVNGTVLDFGNKNIIISETANAAFVYDNISNTITINSSTLSSGNNFNTLKTVGNLILSGTSTLKDITLNASLSQLTPVDLSGVTITGQLTYNSNTPASIVYTNTTISTVVNEGNATIVIKRFNSSINNATDPEIDSYAPTLINITPDGGAVGIYDNNNIRQHFITTNTSLVLAASASGTWSYRIAKYGKDSVYQTFTIDRSTGATINIIPVYNNDLFITANLSAVSAYTDLDTPDKIHDYLSYYQSTSSGIDYGDIVSESFGAINFASSLILDPDAISVADYYNNILTLKSSGVTGDSIFIINGNLSLSGAATLSNGIKIRANNLDSEIYFNNIKSITLYPSLSDRDNNSNAGVTLTASIYRYKYGSVYSGVTMIDNIYSRVTNNGLTLMYLSPIASGTTSIDIGVVGTLQAVLENQKVLNTGIQKASKLIPHTTNLST